MRWCDNYSCKWNIEETCMVGDRGLSLDATCRDINYTKRKEPTTKKQSEERGK